MVKFPEAEKRLFTNMFICSKCNAKVRASPLKVKAKKVLCRKCKSKRLRIKKKLKKTK